MTKVDDKEAMILAAENQRCAALLAADVEALSALLSERLHFMHASAKADDKGSLLAKMRAGNIAYRSLVVDETKVTDLGSSVMLTSRLHAEVDVAGARKTIRNRTLSVWADEGGTWRLVAYQPTPIPA